MAGHSSLTRWLVPQPSYESLTGSDGDASRWVDFLLCAPWMTRPAVIELDGSQHQEAIAVDRSRDAGLRRANIDVLRFAGAQVLSERSELRIRLHAWGRTPPTPDRHLLARLHAPAAATRLGSALLELLDSGALAPGGDWNVDVLDKHEWAALVTGRVLEVFRGIAKFGACRWHPSV